jgi:sporulation protein YlmC with PRC-barrel domain
MAQTVSFPIGAQAWCDDGPAGNLTRVVIDPVGQVVTHLAVQPRHRNQPARLVPVDIAESNGIDVRLRCTSAEFERFDPAEETQFLAGPVGYEDYEPHQVMSWPYFPLRGGKPGVGGPEVPWEPATVTNDAVPAGEASIRRGEPVYATDGPIGHVHGLVVDARSRRVSHVLLAEGHLWDRKEVAIPASAVTGVEEGIKLRISKKEVADLPSVEFDR